MKKNTDRFGWEITKKTFIPFIVFLTLIAGYVFYRIKIVPLISVELVQHLKKYIGTIFIIASCFIMQRFLNTILKWYKERITDKTLGRLDDELIPLLRRITSIILWIIAFLIILPLYGINISALIAALGVSSLAIALAAQDTIANIIAGFLIMIDRPFRIGDRVRIPSGEIVEVLDIGIRRSKFLLEDKSVIIVPNVDLSKSKVINYTMGQELRQ